LTEEPGAAVSADLRCTECGDRIEECECCQREECPSAVCYECMVGDVGQAVTGIHEHGG
jgi:hypothetical protein